MKRSSRTKDIFVVELEPGMYLVEVPAGRTGATTALEEATTYGSQFAASVARKAEAKRSSPLISEASVLPATTTIRLRAWKPGEQRTP